MKSHFFHKIDIFCSLPNNVKKFKNNATVTILNIEFFVNPPTFLKHEILGFRKIIDEQENIKNNCK